MLSVIVCIEKLLIHQCQFLQSNSWRIIEEEKCQISHFIHTQLRHARCSSNVCIQLYDHLKIQNSKVLHFTPTQIKLQRLHFLSFLWIFSKRLVSAGGSSSELYERQTDTLFLIRSVQFFISSNCWRSSFNYYYNFSKWFNINAVVNWLQKK